MKTLLRAALALSLAFASPAAAQVVGAPKGGVAATTACSAHQFVTAVNGSSPATCAQPAAADVSGLAADPGNASTTTSSAIMAGVKAVARGSSAGFLRINVPDGTAGACLVTAATYSDVVAGFAVDHKVLSVTFGNWTGSRAPATVTAMANVQSTFNPATLALSASITAVNSGTVTDLQVSNTMSGTASTSINNAVTAWRVECQGINITLTAL